MFDLSFLLRRDIPDREIDDTVYFYQTAYHVESSFCVYGEPGALAVYLQDICLKNEFDAVFLITSRGLVLEEVKPEPYQCFIESEFSLNSQVEVLLKNLSSELRVLFVFDEIDAFIDYDMDQHGASTHRKRVLEKLFALIYKYSGARATKLFLCSPENPDELSWGPVEARVFRRHCAKIIGSSDGKECIYLDRVNVEHVKGDA